MKDFVSALLEASRVLLTDRVAGGGFVVLVVIGGGMASFGVPVN